MDGLADFFLPFLLIVVSICVSTAAANSKKRQQEASRSKARPRAARQPDGDDAPGQSDPAQAERQPLQPTRHDHTGMFDGSLRADDRTEGYGPGAPAMPSDLSEEAINASLTGEAAPKAGRPAILPDFTGDNLAKAFVFQEILKRPGQRR